MVRARIDTKPKYKPIPKPLPSPVDQIKEAAEKLGKPIKFGDKPKMKDDKYDGDGGKWWEKSAEKMEKKDLPEAPSISELAESITGFFGGGGDKVKDAVEDAADTVGNVVDSIGDIFGGGVTAVMADAKEDTADKLDDIKDTVIKTASSIGGAATGLGALGGLAGPLADSIIKSRETNLTGPLGAIADHVGGLRPLI